MYSVLLRFFAMGLDLFLFGSFIYRSESYAFPDSSTSLFCAFFKMLMILPNL